MSRIAPARAIGSETPRLDEPRGSPRRGLRPPGGSGRGRLALLLGALVAVCGCEEEPAPPGPAPDAEEGSTAPVDFDRRFVDVTDAAGISFRHNDGGRGEKLLPETLGSGAAFLDFDSDGRLDLFFVNSTSWPGGEGPAGPRGTCALYRGDGAGGFTDVSAETGAGVSVYGMGVAIADEDGDGDPDIYITAVGTNVLLRNEKGTFRDVAPELGVAGGSWRDSGGAPQPEWSTAAAWFDADGDGDLDLFVANYVEWTPESEIFTTLDGVHKAFTTPDRYRGLPCRLFLNSGAAGGRFRDATESSGLAAHPGKALGLALWDFDADGRLDVVVANDTRPNFLFMNRGGGRFEERGLALGLAYDENGRARAGMGVDIADYANDGAAGVAIGNFSFEPMSLYRWTGGGGFQSRAVAAGLARATDEPLAFGVVFADLDLDGLQDLVVANGHLEPDIARFAPGQTHAQSPQLFRGRPGGRFADVSSLAGDDFARPRVGRGLAAGDIDGDGDLDLLITANGGRPSLLRNDALPASRNHYLRVVLRGRPPNLEAIGARVQLVCGDLTQTRWLRTGSSYFSQSELALTFGLGEHTKVDGLGVRWPDGEERDYPAGEVDRTITLSQVRRD